MPNARALPAIITYFSVIAGLLIFAVIGMAMTVDATKGLSKRSERDKSLLERRLESAREIRQALAKPVPFEPLSPVTAKVANAKDSEASNLSRLRLSQRARNALASSGSGFSHSQLTPAAVSFDRHSSNF